MESVLQEKINMYDLTQKDLENIYKVVDKDIFDTEDNCFFIDLSNEEAINQEFRYLFYDVCETEQEWLEKENGELKERLTVFDPINTFADNYAKGVKEAEKVVAEALKQFAERLIEKIQNCSGCYIPDCFESPTN